MKRILPFVLALPFAAYAFACSSDDSSSNNNTGSTDGTTPGTNGDGTGDGTGNGNGNTKVDASTTEESSINPTDGVTPGAFVALGHAVHGLAWYGAEKVLFAALPTSTDPFDGTSAPANGKIIRFTVDGQASPVLAGTDVTGEIFSVALDAKTSQVMAVGMKGIFGVISADAGGGPQSVGAPFAASFTANAADDAGAGAFVGLNDVAFKKDGSGFATEPLYGFAEGAEPAQPMRIYQIGATGTAFAVAHFDNGERPNGIALSPDEKTLYVSLTAPTFGTYGSIPVIWKYPVNDDGTLGAGSEFAKVGTTPSDQKLTKPDGMTVDKSGNVYVGTVQGVVVYKPTGEIWGTIATPEAVASVAFGGEDLKTLYMGASNDVGADGNVNNTGTIYKAQMKVTGIAH